MELIGYCRTCGSHVSVFVNGAASITWCGVCITSLVTSVLVRCGSTLHSEGEAACKAHMFCDACVLAVVRIQLTTGKHL